MRTLVSVFIALAAIAILVGGVKGAVDLEMLTFTYQDHNISIDYPKGWTGKGSTSSYLEKETGNLAAKLLRVDFSTPPETPGRETVKVNLLATMYLSEPAFEEAKINFSGDWHRKLYEGNPDYFSFSIDKEYTMLLGGENASVGVATVALKEAPNTAIKRKMVVLITDKTLYTFTMIGLADYSPADLIFEKMLQSFKFPRSIKPTLTPTLAQPITPTPTPTPEPTIMATPKTTGFEAMLTISGMLVVAYIMRRHGKMRK